MEDLVSIIIPTYKRPVDILKRAVSSLLTQTYSNIEIILIDDNATSELCEYRQEIENFVNSIEDDKIVYHQNALNLGSAKSRNIGVSLAKGDIITFLDDDDLYLPAKVKNQLLYLKENDLDMCFTNQVIINQNKEVIDYREYRRIKSFDQNSLMKYHLTHKITGTNTFMLKKALFNKVSGFDEIDMGDEFYLMYKIIESGCKIGYLDDDNVVAYRAGQSSLTLNNNRMIYEKKLYAFIKSKFKYLSIFQRRFSRFRYNVVKLVTYKRAKKYGKMFLSMILAFLSAPVSFFVEPIRLKLNIYAVKKNSRNIIKPLY